MSKKNGSNILSALTRTALAFVFVFGQTAWAAQGQKATERPSSNGTAQTKQAPTNPPTAAVAKAQSAQQEAATAESSTKREESSRGGQHEGITVHGHWTIEVRNPDASLVRHVEFENSLDPGYTVPNPGSPSFVVPGGAAYLSAVLSGQWAAPGQYTTSATWPNWMILLAGPSGLSNAVNPAVNIVSNNSPCQADVSYAACLIIQNTVAPNGTPLCVPDSTVISCNLSVVPVGTAPNFSGLQLTGSMVAANNGQVATVATLIVNISCLASTPPANCLNSQTASFTSSTNFPGAPISVIAGQTIAVTVNISFS